MSELTTTTKAPKPRKPRSPKAIEKAARAARPSIATVPSTDDPRAELVQLVRQHAAATRTKVSLHHQRSDRTVKTGPKKGEIIPCRLTEDARPALALAESSVEGEIARLERAMTKALRAIPIYEHFLSKVYGCGVILSAYLVSEIDIAIREHDDKNPGATKISHLRRFCGLAVIDGRLERRTKGQRNFYNAGLRSKIFTAFAAMWKNAARQTAQFPNGATTKYLDIWRNYKHRMQHSARVSSNGKQIDGHNGARKFIHSTGWHKAADVLIEDLYIVWRTLEGLPVWPSYHAAKLGYSHGGAVCIDAPKMLTLDEALAAVGDVGARPSASVTSDEDESELPDDDADEAAE